jgi:plasmid stability protein
VNDDLFIKRVPHVIKELIGREAAEHHRSVNQETIALLEEALLHRVETNHARRSALATLTHYAAEAQTPARQHATPTAAWPAAGTTANAMGE